jgi:hypothetical protein
VRHIALWLGLFCLPLLTACGNGNDGRAFNPFPKKSTSSVNNPVNAGLGVSGQFLPCHSAWAPSADAGFNAAFAGSVLCPGEGPTTGSKGALARLKVNSGVPVNTRLCMIPFVYDLPTAETCFAINGQADVVLSSDQYTSIVVLSESQLAAYKAYMNDPNYPAPARVIFLL